MEATMEQNNKRITHPTAVSRWRLKKRTYRSDLDTATGISISLIDAASANSVDTAMPWLDWEDTEVERAPHLLLDHPHNSGGNFKLVEDETELPSDKGIYLPCLKGSQKMPIRESQADEGEREVSSRHTISTSRRRLLHLLGATGAAGLAGCSGDGGQGTETETGTKAETEAETKLQGSATIGITRSVSEDWQTVYGMTPYWARVLEPLALVTPELEAKPWLAKDWKRTDDKTWEFYLQEDVTFHNGEPLNADSVIFSLKKFLTEPAFSGFLQSWSKLKPKGIRKVDDHTVELTNTSAFPAMPQRLTHLFFVIQHTDSSKDKKWGGTIGTGPYKLEEIKPDDQMTVSAYDDYWGDVQPQMEELTFRYIEDDNTRALALTGGQIDVGMDLSPSQFDTLNNAKDTDAVAQTAARTGLLHFNNTEPPLKDITLRKALNYAVSQEKIIKGALNGIGKPARGHVPPMIWVSAHDSLPKYGPDKTKAKQLVEKSDYDGKTLNLVSNPGGKTVQNPKLTAQIFQQQAKDVGVEVEIQMLDSSAYDEAVTSGSAQIYHEGVFTSHAMPSDLFESYDRSHTAPSPPFEFDKETEQKLASLLKKADQSQKPQVQKKAFHDLEHLLVEQESIVAPLYYKKYIAGVNAKAAEFDWHPLILYNRMERFKLLK